MRVAIVGMGYVGLVTGVCLAELGHDVSCVDLDLQKVEAVRSGRAPIFEAGLDELLARNLGDRFRAGTDLAEAVRDADVTMIAVGTPFDGNEIDLTAVRGAAQQIGSAIQDANGYPVVVVKSTVVPGTTLKVVVPELELASGRQAGVDFGVGVNPEFLTEGQAVADFMNPDRIVLGSLEERTANTLEELYSVFPKVPRVRTTLSTAELIKYASNALLATMISFSNELADLATAVGDVDIVDVMDGLHSSMYLNVDGRRAPITSFLEAGCGFGGSCLPKDVNALIAHGAAVGHPMRLLRAVIDINDDRADEVLRIVKRHLPTLSGTTVVVLGLAFKPDTDDVRESPAIPIVERMQAEGASVRIHDPVVRELPERLRLPDVSLTDDLAGALDGADAAVLVTRWREYQDELPATLAALGQQPVVVDGRRLIDPESVGRYDGVGRSHLAHSRS
jgi:UDPglucose 6-dehydrogenase/GDP-mannose 6-dehydrogenase